MVSVGAFESGDPITPALYVDSESSPCYSVDMNPIAWAERLVSFLILRPIYGQDYTIAQATRERPGIWASPEEAEKERDHVLLGMDLDDPLLGTGQVVGWKFEDDVLVQTP